MGSRRKSSEGIAGYFPPVSPSLMVDGPSDFEHIYHQPSTYGAAAAAAEQERPASSAAKPAKKGKRKKGAKASSSSVRVASAATTATRPRTPVTTAPFDPEAYLKLLSEPAFGGSVAFTDPWSRERVRMPRPIPLL